MPELDQGVTEVDSPSIDTQPSTDGGTADTAVGQAPPDSQSSASTATDDTGSGDAGSSEKITAKSVVDFLTGPTSVDKSSTVDSSKQEKNKSVATNGQHETQSDATKNPASKVATGKAASNAQSTKPGNAALQKQAAPAANQKPGTKPPLSTKGVGDDPFEGYTEDQKRALGKQTQDRIQRFHNYGKEQERKLKEIEPAANEGKVWAGVLDKYQVRGDLADIKNDASVAEAIKFQAAIHRIAEGRPSRQDQVFVQAVYDMLDATRQQLGMQIPQAAPDYSKLEAAIKLARDNFDMDALDKAFNELKAGNPQAPPQQPQQQQRLVQQFQQQPQQPQYQQPLQQHYQAPAQQAPQGPSPEEQYYSKQLHGELNEAGIKPGEVEKHVTDNLWPAVVSTLAKLYPGQNPVEVYSNLSAQAQYDAVMRAQRGFQKQQESLKPVQAAASTTPRPVRTQGTQKPTGGEIPTSSLALAQYFSGPRR